MRMKTKMTPEQIKAVLDAHWKWLKAEDGGTRADLTDANLTRANLTRADLTRANLTRADLTDANLTGADLTGADLTGADLTGADLTDANLTRADLTRANLTRADLTDANLTGADLTRADLTGADLTDANELSRLIAVPSLHRKILAAIEAGGTLDMGDWHKCSTTHCRAGWAVELAGVAGKVLELCYGPATAGALVSLASCPALNGKVPNFYATTEESLEDIRRLAALEPELEPVA